MGWDGETVKNVVGSCSERRWNFEGTAAMVCCVGTLGCFCACLLIVFARKMRARTQGKSTTLSRGAGI